MIFQILSAHQNIQLKYEALQIMKIISYYDDYCSYLL